MIPPAFDYHAPRSVADALTLIGRLPDAKLLAGGHSLLPMMKLRFAQPAHLIDLNRIASLRGITQEADGTVCIGAMTTENQLIASPLLRDKLPLLPEAALSIADPQVRNRGTIGGDIAHGDPGNDHPALAIAVDASFVLQGPNGARQVKADDFFLGTYMTAMADDEILTQIRAPAFAAGTGWAYEKLKRKTGDWATAAAAVVLRLNGGLVTHLRIALTNVAPQALRAADAEAALIGRPLTDANVRDAAARAMAACDPAEDLRGDIAYKTAMAGRMLQRALAKAASRCA